MSAEGDLNGDGKSSPFCAVGVVSPDGSTLKVATQLTIVNEVE